MEFSLDLGWKFSRVEYKTLKFYLQATTKRIDIFFRRGGDKMASSVLVWLMILTFLEALGFVSSLSPSSVSSQSVLDDVCLELPHTQVDGDLLNSFDIKETTECCTLCLALENCTAAVTRPDFHQSLKIR